MKPDVFHRLLIAVAFAFALYAPSDLSAQLSGESARACEILGARGEVILQFTRPPALPLEVLTRNLSIDSRNADTLTAYANQEQFNWFLQQQIPFRVITPRFIRNQAAKKTLKGTSAGWEFYPSYPQYLLMMESYALNYPGQCRLLEFGTSVRGKKLLALKISDNPEADETEPCFLYTATIHGDEGLGYMLLLRLVDSLLTAYGSNEAITELIDNTEIWINPISNPDGFYYASDSIWFSSTRYNANHVDLNRNFPDPVAGDHPDGKEWQPENIAMMHFIQQHPVVLAANLHDGAELVNYPWDCRTERHADDSWYSTISRQFADTVHRYSPAGFFTDENNGITNGSDWYIIYGGRQDYVNYFLHGREVTIELSHIKTPDPSALPAYWDYYKNSLFGYMQQIHAGIQGTVSDAVTGRPLRAMIEIPDHDKDSSQVFSSPSTGEFYRLLPPGNHTIKISSPGYDAQTIEFSLTDGETRNTAISLLPSGSEFLCFPIPFTHTLNFQFPGEDINNLDLVLTDITGREVIRRTFPGISRSASLTGLSRLAAGIYVLKIHFGSLTGEIKVVK